MPVNDNLGARMKGYYEERSKYKLVRRMPVAIRIDGKAFHTFTRGFEKPFDWVLMESMQETMKYLCENVQGCVLGYTQSDEITLILTDYKKLTSDAYFDNEVQKIASITASMATMKFNKIFSDKIQTEIIALYAKANPDKEISLADLDFFIKKMIGEGHDPILCAHVKAQERGAMFDSRCFNIPKEEVTNLVLWRQLDATRNSIQMVGNANFSQKELDGKTCSDIQEMLFSQKGINWNDYPTECKRGTCCIKNNDGRWVIDKEIPKFVNEDRSYIEKLLESEPEPAE